MNSGSRVLVFVTLNFIKENLWAGNKLAQDSFVGKLL